MTSASPHQDWQAVALSRDIGAKPRQIWWEGQPYVLFRGAEGLSALHDRCPHRHVPLSGGRVHQGQIECPYHGWRFNGGGQCTAIPGLMTQLPRYRIPSLRTAERGGVIFISTGDPTHAPYLHAAEGQDVRSLLVHSETRSTLIDAAENILDATHTHYTHKGLLRGLSSKRYAVNVEVTGGPNWVEASYTGEDRQQGLISALLDGSRVRTIGRYRHPGIAELEYWGPKGLVLATTFHLRQAKPDHVEGIGLLVGPRQGAWGWLKMQAFRPLFRIALQQDRKVLAQALERWNEAGQPRPLIGPLDILRADIEALAAGQAPQAASHPRKLQIEL
ncbi:Rieske (2Fe-2S) protein [Xinfangfangia sp. CPCC 101601]|uniref:Rieske (2Fe-2S) protein n=1 Tax=Pseudogemmobacter lacusdianii TaxID=3069608 RepID=A0ABU0W1I5_9RHOB|nr:Rieske (2Fe-2S) protein [Xinfangfangia sp. CPCC 101601]MDQ2067829.1 Rieske (2Fe-2S) protein [Xinfangfangia sp. CPCC 101601]